MHCIRTASLWLFSERSVRHTGLGILQVVVAKNVTRKSCMHANTGRDRPSPCSYALIAFRPSFALARAGNAQCLSSIDDTDHVPS